METIYTEYLDDLNEVVLEDNEDNLDWQTYDDELARMQREMRAHAIITQ